MVKAATPQRFDLGLRICLAAFDRFCCVALIQTTASFERRKGQIRIFIFVLCLLRNAQRVIRAFALLYGRVFEIL